MDSQKSPIDPNLAQAVMQENRRFGEIYNWLKEAMPASFHEDVIQENKLLICRYIVGFHLQEYFCPINLERMAIVVCEESPDADLKILEPYAMYGIRTYRTYVSKTPPPVDGISSPIRIAFIHFTEAGERKFEYTQEEKDSLYAIVKDRKPDISDEEFERFFKGLNRRFLRSIPKDSLELAIDMFFRAQSRDHCQYELKYNKDWKKTGEPSFEVMFAWKNVPKAQFIYRLARMIQRHKLKLQIVHGAYIDPFTTKSILIMRLGLHGSDGNAVWDVADEADFLRELVTLKFFQDFDKVDQTFISSGLTNGNMGNLIRTFVTFAHQVLLHIDRHFYSYVDVEEALCRHPDLTLKLCEAFRLKFHPEQRDIEAYAKIKKDFSESVEKLDTRQEDNDTRRRNVLKQAMNFIEHTLKTNFYRNNKTAFCFRLDPKYLNHVGYEHEEIFPEIPHGIFFIKGMNFFGFHIRFKELARGGLRTFFAPNREAMITERRNVFLECYNLAYTQHKKNKDIPEGGSKGLLFLQPSEQLPIEKDILLRELCKASISEDESQEKLDKYLKDQKQESIYQAQRHFIESLMSIINADPDGSLRAKNIVSYLSNPEYIYLGPDELMSDMMIDWIADFSIRYDYRPGSCFISGSRNLGINHKQYGVTSLGVNVYMEETLRSLGIDPHKDLFTVKMTGGPDGDVAGNQIANLYTYCKDTAKLVALTDGSGTIRDEEGLDLEELYTLFKNGDPINKYPPEKLNDGGLLLDMMTTRAVNDFTHQTLCWKKVNGQLQEEWLGGSDVSYLYRYNVHSAEADVFIPAGGRPRTLNNSNYIEFLNSKGKPTSRAIIEGANLYLTPRARTKLEDLGVLIMKDSSANKGGVTCSSYEVFSGLALGDDRFKEHMDVIVVQVLEKVKLYARMEAKALLQMHQKTGEHLTVLSDKVSKRINEFKYQILDYLDSQPWPEERTDPIIERLMDYSIPLLRDQYASQVLENVPEHHKKAIVACYLAAKLVYEKGLDWYPSVVDILPLVLLETKQSD